jgi:hypothetical protein
MVSGHRKPAAGFSRPDTGLSGNPGTGRLQPGPFVLFVSFVVKKNSGQEDRFHRRERKEHRDCRRIHPEEHEETRRLKGYTCSFIRVFAPFVLFVSFVVKKNSGQEDRFYRRERRDCRRIHHEEHEGSRRKRIHPPFLSCFRPLRALRVLRGEKKITDKKPISPRRARRLPENSPGRAWRNTKVCKAG